MPLGILFILYAFIFEAAWALSNKSKVSSSITSNSSYPPTLNIYPLRSGNFLILSPQHLPDWSCQFLDETFAGEGERAAEAAFQFEQTQWWTKKCKQVEFFGSEICLFRIWALLWPAIIPSVVERTPVTQHHSSLKDPEMKPILSNGGISNILFSLSTTD